MFVAGALFDITGDYQASFYLSGAVIAISGLLCLPLRRISRWEARRKKTDKPSLDKRQNGLNGKLLKYDEDVPRSP